MKFPQISAGELFELLRPASFFLAAVLSICVLASTRRQDFRLYAGILWALGAYLLPFVVLPLYLIVLIFRDLSPPCIPSTRVANSGAHTEAQVLPIRRRFLPPAVYGAVLLAATGVYVYRDYNSVDAHLARATQAKLNSQAGKTIREYQAALVLEDNPHTHKLLGIELAEANRWTEALDELRLAERGGELDDSLPLRIAQVLSAKGDQAGSIPEYYKFLESHACTQELPDYRCEIVRAGVMRKSR